MSEKDTKKVTAKDIGIIVLIIALVVTLLFSEDIKDTYNSYFGEEEISELAPARVELYKFSDLTSNTSINVELRLINIGGATAIDIEVFVRARNQNGEILLLEELQLTALLLRENETCSATYTVPISQNDTYVLHTIEIDYSAGRTTYSKETKL